MASKNEAHDSCYMTRPKSSSNAQLEHVIHDVVGQTFYIDIGKNQRAFISYTIHKNIIQMDHTEVPEMYKGKGLGKLLAKVCWVCKLNSNSNFYTFTKH